MTRDPINLRDLLNLQLAKLARACRKFLINRAIKRNERYLDHVKSNIANGIAARGHLQEVLRNLRAELKSI